MNIDFTFLKEFKELILLFLGIFLGIFFTIIGTYYSKHIEEKGDRKVLSKSIQWEIEINQLRLTDPDTLMYSLRGHPVAEVAWKFERSIFTSYTNIIGILPMEIGAKILQYYSKLTGLELTSRYADMLLTRDEGVYLFSWDDVLENIKKELLFFVLYKFETDWVKTAKIEKIDDGKTIRIYFENNYISLRLNDEKTKVHLSIYDGRTYEFKAMQENSKLNIYAYTRDITIINWKYNVKETHELGKELIKNLEHIHGENDK